MKKLLIITCLLLTSFVYSQDGYSQSDSIYKSVRAKIYNLDSLSAKIFADKIAKSAKTDYEYYGYKYNKKYLKSTFYYIPKGLTEIELQDIKDFGCDVCLKVRYTVCFIGGNVDLEIKGEPKWVFEEVKGKYLDLFPTWKREFLTTAELKLTLADFHYRDLKNISFGVDVRMQKNNGIWTLKNWRNFL